MKKNSKYIQKLIDKGADDITIIKAGLKEVVQSPKLARQALLATGMYYYNSRTKRLVLKKRFQ